MNTGTLPHSCPEAQGVSSPLLLDFVDALDTTIPEMHGLVLLRRGCVVAKGWWAPCGAELPHMLFSLTKSFVSTGVGFAVSEGRFSINDTVTSFFPEKLPRRVSKNLAAMRVRHLLSMSTGHTADPAQPWASRRDGDWVKGFFAAPVEQEPGARFLYNSAASHVLSALVQKVTGQTLQDYLSPRLFAPLGISPFSWDTDPQGINVGGWGLMMKTEEIARFGQLYLQNGVWNGDQVLPAAWVTEATSRQISNRGADSSEPEHDWNQGYGFQFWRCRHGAYRGDGAFGQFCIVFPHHEAVLAMNGGVREMHAVLNVVWDKLLPAFQPGPLPQDPGAEHALQERLSGLSLGAPGPMPVSALASSVNGTVYVMDPNERHMDTIRVEAGPRGCILHARQQAQEAAADCAYEGWHFSESAVFGPSLQPLAGHAAWVQPDTLRLTLRRYLTPFVFTVDLFFRADQVTLTVRMNVNMGPTEFPAVHGTAKPARRKRPRSH